MIYFFCFKYRNSIELDMSLGKKYIYVIIMSLFKLFVYFNLFYIICYKFIVLEFGCDSIFLGVIIIII